MRTIAVINKKGGAGKTSTVIGLAHGLVRHGYRVGVIDTDPNASATRWLATVPTIDTVPCSPSDIAAIVPLTGAVARAFGELPPTLAFAPLVTELIQDHLQEAVA